VTFKGVYSTPTPTPTPVAHISLLDGPTALASGGSINLGSSVVGGAALGKIFTIKNTGTAVLAITKVTAPAGFTITKAPAANLAAGGSDTLAVALPTATKGVFSGSLTIASSDPATPSFSLALSGRIIVPGTEVWVDFAWSGTNKLGTEAAPYNTLLAGINGVNAGGMVWIKAGGSAEKPRITKAMRIQASGGMVRLGSAGALASLVASAPASAVKQARVAGDSIAVSPAPHKVPVELGSFQAD
jgi:hypothetical protein